MRIGTETRRREPLAERPERSLVATHAGHNTPDSAKLTPPLLAGIPPFKCSGAVRANDESVVRSRELGLVSECPCDGLRHDVRGEFGERRPAR